jgi:hypothetical protein
MLLIAATAVLTLSGDPAVAVDVTGTWDGTVKCTTQEEDIDTSRDVFPLTMSISQSGTELRASVNDLPAFGQATDDGVDKDKGFMAVGNCSPPSLGFTFGGGGKVTIGVSRSKIDGQITGFMDGIVQICKLKLTRTDPADPGVSPCP